MNKIWLEAMGMPYEREKDKFRAYVEKLVKRLDIIIEAQDHPEDQERLDSVRTDLLGGNLEELTVAWIAYLDKQETNQATCDKLFEMLQRR